MAYLIKILFMIIYTSYVITDDQFLPKGQYEFLGTSIEKCPGVDDETQEVITNLHLQRVNQKRVNVLGNLTLKMKADDNVGIEYILDRWGNGGWRPNSYVLKHDNACESLRTFGGKLFEHIYNCIEGECLKRKPGQPYCPAYPGIYQLKDIDIKEFDDVNIPAAQLGRWRMTLYVKNHKTKKQIGCYRTTMNIVKKRAS